jgi:hypothetical protein
LSLVDAAAKYVAIVHPHNMAMNELFAVEGASGPWTDQRQALAKIFAVDETEVYALADTAWPAEVQLLIDRLIQVKLAHRQAMSDAVHASTEAEFLQLAFLAFVPPECVEANAVRAALGLGEAGGNCPTPTTT